MAQKPAPESTRERFAALAHEQWSGWMVYLFTRGCGLFTGQFIIDADQVERWRRQMQTPYAELPESEKASDRVEADKMLAIAASVEQDTSPNYETLWHTAARSVVGLYWQNRNIRDAYARVMQERDAAEKEIADAYATLTRHGIRDESLLVGTRVELLAHQLAKAVHERDELRQRLARYEEAERLRGLLTHAEYESAIAALVQHFQGNMPGQVPYMQALIDRVVEYEHYHYPTVEPTPEARAAFREDQMGETAP